MRGPLQNEEGQDGIVDNSYTIPPGNNVERYPFRQNLLFPDDEIDPEILPIYPFPGYLHINFIGLPILGRITLVISIFQKNLIFNAKANEPPDAKWQSNLIMVSYELKNPQSNHTFNSGEIKFDVLDEGYYRWRLPKIPLLDIYELTIKAKDSAGNTKNYTLAPLYIMKIP